MLITLVIHWFNCRILDAADAARHALGAGGVRLPGAAAVLLASLFPKVGAPGQCLLAARIASLFPKVGTPS